ncbi:reticulocyte-binding protein 2 like protein a [Fusarium bulbicola]|nr:reticulocyte-binding protein 2 like protein a [Fusarium bulbicola]
MHNLQEQLQEARRNAEKSRKLVESERQHTMQQSLKPWHDFLDPLPIVSYRTSRLRERNLSAILRHQITQRPVAGEKTLESFLHDNVWGPVQAIIIDELKPGEEARRAFQIGDSVIYETYPHAVSDVAKEVGLLAWSRSYHVQGCRSVAGVATQKDTSGHQERG